jgi:hypothetical protein
MDSDLTARSLFDGAGEESAQPGPV